MNRICNFTTEVEQTENCEFLCEYLVQFCEKLPNDRELEDDLSGDFPAHATHTFSYPKLIPTKKNSCCSRTLWFGPVWHTASIQISKMKLTIELLGLMAGVRSMLNAYFFTVVTLIFFHCECIVSKNAHAVRRGPVSKAGFKGRWLAIVCWDFKRPQKHGVLFQLIWKHGCCECHLCFVVRNICNGVPEILTEGWS